MNSPDEQMRAVKTAMGKDDPAVAVLSTMTSKIGSMQESLEETAGKVDSIKEAGETLRIARVGDYCLMLFLGLVLGAVGTWYWMSGHGFMGHFWTHGIKVQTVENSDRLQLRISGANYDSGDWILDQQGNKIGVLVTYRKESKP